VRRRRGPTLREFKGQAGRRSASTDVIVQIPVEPLEAGIEVRGQGDEQKFDVQEAEFEAAHEHPEAELPSEPLHLVGFVLDLRQDAPVLGIGRQPAIVGAGAEGPVHMLIGQVEPPQWIVGIRIGAPSALDGPPDPVLAQAEVAEKVEHRRRAWGRRSRARIRWLVGTQVPPE